LKTSENPPYWPERKELKRNGGYRKFNVPKTLLRNIQKKILDNLLTSLKMPDSFYGGMKGKSAEKNADKHVGRFILLKYDIKEFFPSIRPSAVYKAFTRDLDCTPEIARILTELTTHKHGLPQGAPTSPMIAALVLKKAEFRISNMLKPVGIHPTIYVDDICFSSDSCKVLNYENSIRRILQQCGFKINQQKFKGKGIAYSWERQEITGFVVNKKRNIPKNKYKQLRSILYNCAKHGVAAQKEKYYEAFQKELTKNAVLGRISQMERTNANMGKILMKVYNLIKWD
jgi:hypothetical protein